MSQRQIVLLLALVVSAVVPATASATPTVTVTGDDGNQTPLNLTTPLPLRNMDVTANVVVPRADGAAYTTQVVDQAGTGASDVSPCRDTEFGPTWSNFADYRGDGVYSVVIREFKTDDCTGAATQRVFRYQIVAGLGITAPPARLLTRAPNSFVTNTHEIGISLNPGASIYEVRYALGGVAAADGSISGPSKETFLDTSTGLAPFRFDKPGRYLLVARASRNSFFTPWSGAVTVNAIAPFDLERVTFPDSRGPSYKLRGQVRERVARGKVTVYWAKGKKGGKFHKAGKAKINSKGRFTKRFTLRRFGIYRLRYTYKGSSLVAGGRVTEQIRIRKRIFFG
jgi:hypothetical protein